MVETQLLPVVVNIVQTRGVALLQRTARHPGINRAAALEYQAAGRAGFAATAVSALLE
jgi:hypothetical protein